MSLQVGSTANSAAPHISGPGTAKGGAAGKISSSTPSNQDGGGMLSIAGIGVNGSAAGTNPPQAAKRR